ncbi:MAG TPA: glycine--tRNA ligase subunit beta [Thermoanaerobaculia bacterium]|nr:glycine--tRNA ligase subunit beta [Thermoanaerobaculia bacterium]
MAEYFCEILLEEIPAWMIDAARASMTAAVEKLFAELGQFSVTTNATPRRLVLFLENVPDKQADRDEEVKGPPRKAAYDAEGNPTPALHGFLKKNNATAADLLDGGDYVRIRRTVSGRAAGEILQQRIPQIVESLRWPKMMRWGAGAHSYIRPLHGIVSSLDGEHLPIEIFGVKSGLTTVGHRILANDPVRVTTYNDYVTKLELASVVVDATRRRHVMAERARVLAAEANGTPSVDASIWSQWQYLTEYPGVVRGEFRAEYLTIPEEVLVMVMRVHQKQLPVRDAGGRLTNSFLAVLDNDGDEEGNARYGNSFVTNARFADAKFFYETDRKRPLAERREQLSHLEFHAKLGNYLEKTQRITRIARELSGNDPATVEAAELCKCDLVTEMVKEFTELQGQVGGIYAREEALPDGVWQAIYDHYLPINVDDALPRTLSGAYVSLADKIDTLVGFFKIGVRPTGSKDPFALRRAAQGVVQLLLNRDKRQLKVRTNDLFDLAIRVNDADPAIKQDLVAFFSERIETVLETSAYGFAYDEIQAAMTAGWEGTLTDLVDRVSALNTIRTDPNFLNILDSAKRIANITAGHDSTHVDSAKLENETERRLNELATLVGAQIDEMIGEREYRRALESFAALAPELEKFFDDVMVMVDDEGVRRNRMSLLRKVGNAVTKIADVTKIVVDRSTFR